MTAKEMAKRLVTHQGKEKALQMSQELAKVSLLVKQNKGGIEFNDEIEAAKKKKATHPRDFQWGITSGRTVRIMDYS